jgi:hypothetical protein
MNMETMFAIIGSSFFLSPALITYLIVRHRERMAAMRNRQEGAPGLIEEVSALRRDVAALRDTTTRFDMSFDAALHRVEQRLDTLEQNADETRVDSRNSYRPSESVTVEQTILRPR